MGKYSLITHYKTKEFIESLDKIRKARVDRIYYLFEEYGINLPSKYLKKLDKEIWELRPGDIRLFLGIKGRTGIIVHGIFKKTKKIPRQDLELARKRIKEEI